MNSNSGSSRSFFAFRVLILAAVALGLASASEAQDKVELYGGYSYFRASIREVQNGPALSSLVSERTNLNGWEFSAQYKFLPFLGAVVDSNGNYGTLRGAGTREHTFLFGPQVSLPTRVSPFAHALFGVAKESQETISNVCPVLQPTCTTFSSLGSDTSFASAIGAGIDIRLLPHAYVRVFQIDYVRTQLHRAAQNQPRASAGVVFHF